MTFGHVAAEVSHQLFALPVLWLGARLVLGLRDDAGYWWIAAGFLVSWFADGAAHQSPEMFDAASIVYPAIQAALAAAPFLVARDRWLFLAVLVSAGVWSVVAQHDIPLDVVAWGGVCGIVADRVEQGQRRRALLVFFGGSLIGWPLFEWRPSAVTWWLYHGPMAAGLVIFCRATLSRTPRLTLTR